MTRLHFARLSLVLLLVFGSVSLLSAQAVETYIFGGGYWSGNEVFDTKMAGGGTWGLKVGGYLDPNFELDGNVSWYNHFATGAPMVGLNLIRTTIDQSEVNSFLWEGSGTYHFGQRNFLGNGFRFTPYVTFGLGGMTARIKDEGSVFLSGGGLIRNPLYITDKTPVAQFIPNPARQVVMDDNDTFFTFSYGGGIKAMRVWGPAGFRADFRGRTIPNFFSEAVTRPELTAGLIFSWGE